MRANHIFVQINEPNVIGQRDICFVLEKVCWYANYEWRGREQKLDDNKK
jgi:hypothetical protein